MLRQRVITAFILGAVIVWGVLALPQSGFGLLLLAITLAAAWEWSALASLSSLPTRLAYCALIGALVVVAWWLYRNTGLLSAVLGFAALFWCAMLVRLWLYSKDASARDSAWSRCLIGCILLVVPWLALMVLREPQHGPYYVLFLLVLIWLADSGAYFAGRRWGRHKLAPAISPGKTWEGAIGAIAVSVLFALLGFALLDPAPGHWLGFLLLCILTVAISIIGDLFESMYKRQLGVKDSGSLLPGHGGMLDRIDSITAAAPIFVLGLLWL